MIEKQRLLFLTTGCVTYDCGINFSATFEQMFSEVINYNYVEKANSIGNIVTNSEIIEIVKKEKPDYVFWTTNLHQIEIETLDRIAEMGIKVIAWFSDDHWRFDNYSKHMAGHVYCSVTTDKCAVEKYKRSGLRVIRSQWASNPNYYKKTNHRLLYDVSFVGGKYGNRQEKLDHLKSKCQCHINIFGKGFSKFLEFDEMIEVFNSSRINLNLSESSTKGFGSQIKGRVFEITMCGGFLLTEHADGIEEYFEIGKEIECFESLQEALVKIEYYLKYEDKRKEIAEAGYARAMKEHTWEKRLKNIFYELEDV